MFLCRCRLYFVNIKGQKLKLSSLCEKKTSPDCLAGLNNIFHWYVHRLISFKSSLSLISLASKIVVYHQQMFYKVRLIRQLNHLHISGTIMAPKWILVEHLLKCFTRILKEFPETFHTDCFHNISGGLLWCTIRLCELLAYAW